MIGVELVYLAIVLVVVGTLLFAVRRASMRNQLPKGDSARRQIRGRIEEDDEEEDDEDEDLDEQEADQEDLDDEEHDEGDEGDEAEDDEAEEGDDSAEEEALRAGLARTRGGFVARIGKLFSKKKIDDDVLGELEEVLFTADIGPGTAERLFKSIKSALSRSELEDVDAVWDKLREESKAILEVESSPLDWKRERPLVLLVLGVNGVGKTTTIGKVAAKLSRAGHKVLLAAGDTFRAAAVEQLEIWGERSGCKVVKGKSGGDPSSVIFDAIKTAQNEDYDIVIADTAGRLHTKVELMEELKKVGRVVDKAQPGAPHETWLVLDSTTGQNAIQQAQIFKEAMAITGIVLTKLDGTAKGGVILGICDELSVPVRFIGIGEQIDDLREFDASSFVSALYEQDDAADAA
jgi:fused signal recognition particle receptor